MNDFHLAITLMCGAMVLTVICTKLIVDAFIRRLIAASANTSKSIELTSRALTLNSRAMDTIEALLAQRIEHQPSKLGVDGSNPSERAT
jgi:hypothetical protein